MNGAIYDSTTNVFFKLKYAQTYEAVLTTPVGVPDVAVGEIAWALFRGTLYALGFMVVMLVLGLVSSPAWLLAVPASVLIGFAFAAVGMALTTWIRSWADFDKLQMVLLPMFLFSATFYPITAYPPALRILVELTPLYHGVDLLRGLTTGFIGQSQARGRGVPARDGRDRPGGRVAAAGAPAPAVAVSDRGAGRTAPLYSPAMNVTTTPAPRSTVVLEVELPADRLQLAIDESVRRLGRRTRVAGFRPGRAPRVMLERALGVQRGSPGTNPIYDEAKDQLFSGTMGAALDQASLDALDHPGPRMGPV